MQKPAGFDVAQCAGEFEQIELGGHHLVIRQVREEKTQSGKVMLKVAFETAEKDRQPGFFKKKFAADTRAEKKWPGVATVFVEGFEAGTTSQYFKGFCTAVERSNPGFRIQWVDDFGRQFANKLVGGVFREEDFEDYEGKVRTARKIAWFCSDDAADEQAVPKRKQLKISGQFGYSAAPQVYDEKDFHLLEDDDDLPF